MIKRKNIVFISLVLIITVCATFYGVSIKKTFIDNSDGKVHMKEGKDRILQIYDDKYYSAYFFDNMIKDYRNLYDKSNLVAVIKIDGDRVNKSQTLVSDVKVLKVIKKPNFKIGNHIKVYEPSSFLYNDTYEAFDGYNIMEPEKEYIMFLETLLKDKDYKGEKHKCGFKPVSTLYSKYSIENDEKFEIVSSEKVENQQLSYDDIKNFAIITKSNEEIQKYKTLRSEIIPIIKHNVNLER